jgi:hypothetical protein
MQRRKILAAAEHYIIFLTKKNYVPQRAPRNYQGTDPKIWGDHALRMAHRIKLYIYTGHRDKAMRWLSNLQGILLAIGEISINQAKEQFMPNTKRPC